MNSNQQQDWWQVFHKFQQSREKTWLPKLNSALKSQYKSAADYLKDNGIQQTISQLPALITYDTIGKIIKNIYIDAGTVFGGKAYQMVKKKEQKHMLPIGYNEDLINEIIHYFQTSLLSQAVIPITERTKDIILKILTDSQQNGVSIDDIVSQLTATDLSYQRSRTIARTETVAAANAGAIMSVKKLGYDTVKIWISSGDNRTRRQPRDAADHLHANGQTVAMDDYFTIMDRDTGGIIKMRHPGDKIGGPENCCNCRCTTGFSVV